MSTPPQRTAVLALALALAGCGSPEARIEKNPEIYGSLNAGQQTQVKQGELAAGMNPDAVFLAWGRPDRVRRQVDAEGEVETWVYLGHRTEVSHRFRPLLFGRYEGYLGGENYDYVTVPYVYRTASFRRDRLVAWETPRE